MKINTKQIALAGIMLAISAILVNTPLGMIPVPTMARYATIMHIPVIIVGILEGPFMGAVTGLLFGLLAYMKVPEFGPLVHLLPRPLVGLIPALLYIGLSRIFSRYDGTFKETFAVILCSVTGSLINTVGVLGLAVLLMPDLMPISAAWVIGLSSGIPEAVFSAIIALPIVFAIKRKFYYRYAPIANMNDDDE